MTGPQPTFEPAAGAIVQPQYMGRTMKCYPVHENEIESLGTYNNTATAFFSIASASFAFAIGILTNAAFTNEMTDLAKLATILGAPVLIVLSVIFLALGVAISMKRASLWNRIKTEAVTLHATTSSAL